MEDWRRRRRGKQNNGEINGSVIHPCLLILGFFFLFFFPPFPCFFFSCPLFPLRGSDAAHEPSLPSCQLSSISLARPTILYIYWSGWYKHWHACIPLLAGAAAPHQKKKKANKKQGTRKVVKQMQKIFDRASVSLSKTNLEPERDVQQVILQWVAFLRTRRHEWASART